MPCYHPIKGYRSAHADPITGRHPFTFNKSKTFSDHPIEMVIPCQRCIGCRFDRSRQWALRCKHAASPHPNNCFITLTYNNENLPPDLSLQVRDVQLFMKRLRKRCGAKKIKTYYCGEYGPNPNSANDHPQIDQATGKPVTRPHYHALLFNHDFEDKKLWQRQKSGDDIYRSAELEQLWQLGYSSTAALTFKSAAYVARYVMKKITGPTQAEHYQWTDIHGRVHPRKPEFSAMSNGIGKAWIEKYSLDFFPRDYVIHEGRKYKVPKYYDKACEAREPELFEGVKKRRHEKAKKYLSENTPERLHVRETVAKARMANLKRGFHHE